MSEISEMKALFATGHQIPPRDIELKGNGGHGILLFSFRSHERKQDDVPDRLAVGEQHHQSIDPDALAGCRRQAVLERPDVVLVHRVRLEVATLAGAQLGFEPPPLLGGVVELAEGVGDLHSSDV